MAYAEEPLMVIAREYVMVLRRKLRAQDEIAECTRQLAQLEEQLRRFTQGQVYGQPEAGRLPLPEPGEGTRVVRTGEALLGLKDGLAPGQPAPWSFEYRS